MSEPAAERVARRSLACAMPWLAALLLGSFGSSAGAQEAPALRAQQAAERWAAVTAAREVISGLDDVPPEGLTGKWSQEILDDPRSHQSIQASRALLERQYSQEMKELLRRRLARLHSSLNPAGTPPSFSAEWLVGYVEERLDGEVSAALRTNADRHFGGLFDQARQTAVAAQLAALELDARPGLDEIDAVAVSGWSPTAQNHLRDTLVARMSRSTTLLEESAARLEEKASGVIADARRQYEGQAAAVELPVAPGLRVADDLSRAVAAQVEQVRLQLRMAKGPDYPLYEVFPSVLQQVQVRAGELELRRFSEYVQRAPMAVDPEELRSRVEGDLEHHRHFDESLDRLRNELSPALSRELLDEYVRPVADRARRAAFRERLGRGIEENAELSAAFKGRVEAAVGAPLRAVRVEIAEEQMAALFPEVASGRFVVPESVLIQLHRKEFSLTSFEQCLAIPHLRDGGGRLDRGTLLDVTEEMVLERTGKLVAEGQRAWKGQLQLVRQQEPSITQTLRRVQDAHPVAYWESFFIDEVDAQWRKVGHPALWRNVSDLPENAETKYLRLFGYVEDEIRKNVRTHFEPRLGTGKEPDSEVDTKREPSQTAGTTGEGEDHDNEEDSKETVEHKGWWFWGPNGIAEASWLTWLMLLLTVLLIVLTVQRYGAWRAALSAGAWVLATAILFASFWLLGRRVVDVADLGQATAELQEILGVPPASVDARKAVFKVGPISRIVLQQAEPSRGDGIGPGSGGER